eukprot:jgi/Chlat1/6638/Chrsp49S09075
MNGFGGFGFGHSRALLQQLLSEDPFAVFDHDPFFSHGTTSQYHPRRVPPGLQAAYAALHPQYYITDEHGRREGTYGNGATVRDIPITGPDPHAPSAASRGNISIQEMDPEEEHPFVSQQRARSQHAIVEHPDEDGMCHVNTIEHYVSIAVLRTTVVHPVISLTMRLVLSLATMGPQAVAISPNKRASIRVATLPLCIMQAELNILQAKPPPPIAPETGLLQAHTSTSATVAHHRLYLATALPEAIAQLQLHMLDQIRVAL